MRTNLRRETMSVLLYSRHIDIRRVSLESHCPVITSITVYRYIKNRICIQCMCVHVDCMHMNPSARGTGNVSVERDSKNVRVHKSSGTK